MYAHRYANSGHVVVGHAADAGQRAPAVLLRFLHIRHRWRPAVGRSITTALLPRITRRGPSSQLLVSIVNGFSFIYLVCQTFD